MSLISCLSKVFSTLEGVHENILTIKALMYAHAPQNHEFRVTGVLQFKAFPRLNDFKLPLKRAV
jgi:hypothetical protein